MFSDQLIFIPFCNVLHIRHWGEECVVYSEISAETHLLRHPSGSLLESLIRGPKTIGELALELEAEFLGESHEDILSYVLTSTQTFRDFGLLDIQEPVA